jgi:hypothetical protein
MAVIVAENMDGKVAQDIKDLKVVYFYIQTDFAILTLDQERCTAAGSEYALSSHTYLDS